MSRFDEEPDGDPHGECAAEIHRLQAEVANRNARALAGDKAVKVNESLVDEIERLRAELAEVYGNDSARDAVAMLRNAVAKGFQFALCVEAEKSTACLHNTDDGKVCAQMLERFARQQRGAEAT